MITIGIDPGSNGGIAIEEKGKVSVTKMPATYPDIGNFFKELSQKGICKCYLENVGKHVIGNHASSSAKFARHCGHIEMALYDNGIQVVLVSPSKWMNKIPNIPKGKDKKKQRKNAIKQAMQMAYPRIKVTLWAADALGILTYGVTHE